jgi:hypothetical protein
VSKGSLQTFMDSATATQALLSGQADVVSGSFLSDLQIIQKGTALRGLVSVSNGNDLLMIGRGDIDSIQKVTGNKAIVATDSPGGLINLIYNAMFLAKGIKVNVEKLPHTKPYGDSPPRTGSFITGQTNVCVVHSTDMPKILKAVGADKVHTLSTLWQDVHGLIFEVIASTQKWIDANADKATAIVSAVLKGNRELAKSYPLYKKAVNDFIPGSGLKDADIMPIWKLARQFEFWPYNGGVDTKAVNFTQQVGNQSGQLTGTVPAANAIDTAPLTAALKKVGTVTVQDIAG